MSSPAAVLAAALARLGSDRAFGVPGGGPNLDVVGAMEACGIGFVLAHGETAACIMASVYGHLTGRPTAAVVTRGPGAASAVNGAAQATLDRHPLVLVTDTVPAADARRVPHQRIDQRAMLAPVTKATAVLGAGADVSSLVEWLTIVAEPPKGAIHLDYDAGADHDPPARPAKPTARPTAGSTTAVRSRVTAADRPVVILGLGAVDHAPALRPVLESFAAPVLTTYQAIGALPTEDRRSAGLFTNGHSERPLLDEADLVVAVGLDPVEPIPAPWPEDLPVVSITDTPTVDPYFPTESELVADIGVAAADVLVPGHHTWPDDAGRSHRRAVRRAVRRAARFAEGADGHRGGLTPVDLVETAIEHTPSTTTVTVDAGAHFLAIMPLWPVASPKRLLISNGLATMGYAVPAAVAAALARPGDPVLCLVGDGGLGMTLAELETIGRLRLPVTVVVFNDSALSLIEIKQRNDHGGPGAVRFRATDFASMAPSFGLDGVMVETTEALAVALEGDPSRPRLIDARVDPASYPQLLRTTRG